MKNNTQPPEPPPPRPFSIELNFTEARIVRCLLGAVSTQDILVKMKDSMAYSRHNCEEISFENVRKFGVDFCYEFDKTFGS